MKLFEFIEMKTKIWCAVTGTLCLFKHENFWQHDTCDLMCSIIAAIEFPLELPLVGFDLTIDTK